MFVTSAERGRRGVPRASASASTSLIPLYYDPAIAQRGYIETKDRFGVLRRFPIMSVSIAAISLRAGEDVRRARRARRASASSTAKAIPGSSYVRDGQTIAEATATS